MGEREQEVAARGESLREAARLLDLPADGVADLPKASLTGEQELYLKATEGVLSYGRERSMWTAAPGSCGSPAGSWKSRPCGPENCGSWAGSPA